MTPPIAHRPLAPADVPFVLSSWLQAYHASLPAGARRILGPAEWFPAHRAVVERVLQGAAVTCAVIPDAAPPCDLYGYLVHAPGVVHWLYVKPAYRRFGVARYLLAVAGLAGHLDVTFATELGDRVARRLGVSLRRVRT